MSKIVVKNSGINVIQINEEDYICLTDMIKANVILNERAEECET